MAAATYAGHKYYNNNNNKYLKISEVGVAPHQPFFFSENLAKWSFIWCKKLDSFLFRLATIHASDRRTDRILIARPRLHLQRGNNYAFGRLIRSSWQFYPSCIPGQDNLHYILEVIGIPSPDRIRSRTLAEVIALQSPCQSPAGVWL